MDLLQGAGVAAFLAVQALASIYSSHRCLTLVRCRRPGALPPAAPFPAERWPTVTVQLPIYDERLVVDRLIDAAAALDYPAGRLEIQVLDDSTDDTTARAARRVAFHRARGADIRLLRRGRRDGYKAGALAFGLARARGELFAVFDADFLPAPDFLRRLVPRFADPGVGMVQARWEHVNRDRSLLTAAQAVMLDSHFLLEHEARMRSGLFFNFNGTAGVWRRSCIEDAGGWTHDTLTEDLDLSYRAQLRGWRFVFDAGVAAPAELPAGLLALKSQQRRWARGSVQTARKLLGRLMRSRAPFRVRLEALLHLTGNLAYPLLLALGLLLPAVLFVPPRTPPGLAAAFEIAAILVGVVPVVLFLVAGQLAAGRRGGRVARDVAAALVLGAGLSWNNAVAVVRGLGPRLGDWVRTPKSGDGAERPALPGYAAARVDRGRAEIALAIAFAAIAVLAGASGHWRTLPFVVLMAAGLAAVGIGSARSAGRRSVPRLPEPGIENAAGRTRTAALGTAG